MRVLRVAGVVPAGRDRLFTLLEDARMADRLNPEFLRIEVVRAPWLPKVGERTTLRVTHRGVAFALETEIAEFRRGSFLLERQVAGPFTSFEHALSLEDDRSGSGTLMTEVLAYGMRLGPLGRLADRLALRHDLHRLLRVRQQRLRDLFSQE